MARDTVTLANLDDKMFAAAKSSLGNRFASVRPGRVGRCFSYAPSS
ncbi:MAG: hypothetical protein WA946_12690 [Nitrospirota bacterium]